MTDKLREALEKVREDYDDACNLLVASTPDESARDAEMRRLLEAFTDLYEAALADSVTAETCPTCGDRHNLGCELAESLAATADAPPEPTEEMVRLVQEAEGLFDELENAFGREPKDVTRWRDRAHAALATAQEEGS